MRRYLDPNQFRLYELIWKRTVASQMNPAVYDTVALDLAAGESTAGEIAFRATGSVLVSPGFIAVYTKGSTTRSSTSRTTSCRPWSKATGCR